jgi:hypothetical protein
MPSLKTQTFSPNAALVAPGHKLAAVVVLAAAVVAAVVGDAPATAALTGTAITVDAASAAATIKGLPIRRMAHLTVQIITVQSRTQSRCNQATSRATRRWIGYFLFINGFSFSVLPVIGAHRACCLVSKTV